MADDWASDVVLGDGGTVHIRPIRPSDAPRLAEFHRQQPAESNYRRYFSPKPELSDRELAHFTEVDMVDRVALVAEERGEMIAWASYERYPGRPDADAAFQVDDTHQGRGLATLLLEHLAAIARTNGINRFTAEVLADNRAMLTVFSRAGWPVQRRFESGVVDLDWPLEDTSEFLDSVERREQRADSRAVARLLMPRSIAVVGASDEAGSIGHVVWTNVVRGAAGPVFPVNWSHETVGGQPAFASLAAIPDDVSLAVVAVPADRLEGVIDDCIAARVRGAIVITSVEWSSDIDVAALVARARRYGVRIIGPGSMGVASSRPEIGLHASLMPVDLIPGPVAISLQSGSLGASVLGLAGELGIGVSWFVSLGDKRDISGNDLLQFWEDDETTRVIAMYTETFGNPRKFARIARRVSRRRPIVAVRTGAAAAGPTGSALYHQAGLIEVPTVASMLDVARVLATQPVPQGPRVAVLSNAHSPYSLAAAALTAAGLEARPSPVVLDWRSTAADFAEALRHALGDDQVDAVLVVHAPPIADQIAAPSHEIDAAAAGSSKPVVAVLLGASNGPLVAGSNVPVFSFPEPAAAVLGRAWAYGQWLQTEGAIEPVAAADIDQPRAADVIATALQRGATELTVEESVELLGAYGISLPPTTATTADEAVAAAEKIGYPVAVKATHRHLGRSTRAGVALDLTDPADVEAAIATMREAIGDDAEQVLVQAMTPPGLEVRIDALADERLGALVAVGLGGVGTALLDDEARRLAPLSTSAADRLVRQSRAGAALEAQGIDLAPITDVVVRAAQLAADHPELHELDLNPVIVSDGSCWVTDVKTRVEPSAFDRGPLRRLS